MFNKIVKILTVSFLSIGMSASVFACAEGSDNPDCSCPMHAKKDVAQDSSNTAQADTQDDSQS